MSESINTPPLKKSHDHYRKPLSRRNFLRFASASAATALAFGVYGCKDMNSTTGITDTAKSDAARANNVDTVDLGTGDIGVLNFAYALEQLEAAFYTEVLANPAHDLNSEQGRVLEDLQKHEVAHRDFYKAALGSDAIPALTPDFSSVDFSKCADVLKTARTFEDLGVSAYNGAGQLLENPDFLLVAGKIVSVEARHAAAIRDLLNPRSAFFAGDDIIDENGLDLVRTPNEVLEIAAPFIKDEIDASGLPQPSNS